LKFKGETKLFNLENVKLSILLNNALQHCPQGWKKLMFVLKKSIHCGDKDETGISESAEIRMRFNFSSR